MKVNLLFLIAGLLFLLVSVLGVYKPDLTWGRPRTPPRTPQDWARLRRRRMVGTIVYFAIGAALLLLSVR